MPSRIFTADTRGALAFYCMIYVLVAGSGFESIHYPSFVASRLTCVSTLSSSAHNRRRRVSCHVGSRGTVGIGQAAKTYMRMCTCAQVPRIHREHTSKFLGNDSCETHYICTYVSRGKRERERGIVEKKRMAGRWEINDRPQTDTYSQFSDEPAAYYVFMRDIIFNY